MNFFFLLYFSVCAFGLLHDPKLRLGFFFLSLSLSLLALCLSCGFFISCCVVRRVLSTIESLKKTTTKIHQQHKILKTRFSGFFWFG